MIKKILLLFTFLGVLALIPAGAQCSQKKEAKAKLSHMTALKAAALDKNIEQRIDRNGKASFVKRSINSANGEVHYSKVQYCSRSGKFISSVAKSSPACIKSKAECIKTIAQGVCKSQPEACTPAQRAACAGAAAKTKAKLALAKAKKNKA